MKKTRRRKSDAHLGAESGARCTGRLNKCIGLIPLEWISCYNSPPRKVDNPFSYDSI